MILSEPNSVFTNDGTIGDGLTIAASGISFINSDSGRIVGGITFATGGSSVENLLGGIIRSVSTDSFYTGIVVSGSSGDDRLLNAGLINGLVSLGGGNDVYVERDGRTNGVIDFGSGDDLYRVEGDDFRFLHALGGDGWDTVVMANTNYQIWGDRLSGFEEVVFELGGNMQYFSGFQKITLAFSGQFPFFNFLDCLNPLVDLTLSAQAIALHRSSVNSITGSGGSDAVELGVGAVVLQGIALGAGDDGVTLWRSSNAQPHAVGGLVDAGAGGRDILSLFLQDGADVTYDLTKFVGFEAFFANSSYVAKVTMRVANLAGVNDIRIGDGGTLLLSASNLPDANVAGNTGGSFVLSADSTIGRYGAPLYPGNFIQDVDLQQGNDLLNSTFVNNGTVLGEVRFYVGDDLYDGRSGSVGGTVYGNAGNDTLLGGAGAERFEGGYGADDLSGGLGADQLTGGAGKDTFRDTAAGLDGDTITDFSVGDRIVITDATLSGFSFSVSGNVLSYTGGSITLGQAPSGRIVAAVAGEGGVELSLPASTVVQLDPANDFNGDGRSDVLWRNDSGRVTNWLGQANGSFVGNFANANLALTNDWQVAGSGDFDGDGRDDVLWRASNGTVTNWLGQANGGFAGNFANANLALTNDWQVAGVGDFNGDGRDDVLWRASNGTVTNWLGQAGGGFAGNFANANLALTTEWKIAGVGDFNRDGHDDILWRHTNGTITNWLGQANGGFAGNFENANLALTNDWKVAGVGDFNGDGHDDVLWRHLNGTVTDWLGNASGGFTGNFAYANAGQSTAWRIVGVGDYNGDGRDDILWRNPDGTVTDWLGQANGGFAGNGSNATLPQAPDWQVTPASYLI